MFRGNFDTLKHKENDACTVNYIACVDSDDCKYDGGSGHIPCIECKMKWLNEEWEE